MILSPIKSKYQINKINIDFEYMNDIYSITADPYNTLLELKGNILKKIFPVQKNIHCFYQNLDISEKEDEQISKLFPFKKKIKIVLKNPSKEKNTISKSNIGEKKEVYPKIDLNSNSVNKNNQKKNYNTKNNIIKKRISSFSSLLDIPKERRKTINELEFNDDDLLKNDDELFYYLNKNKAKKYKLINNNKNLDINDMDILNEKSKKHSILSTEKKPRKKIKQLSLNIRKSKTKNNNYYVNLINNCLNQNGKEEIKIDKKTIKDKENNKEFKEDDFLNYKFNNDENNLNKDKIDIINNDNKENINYICSFCDKNLITFYCLNCNKFICNNCLEKCKLEKHESIKINMNDDCISNINSYGSLILSKIEKKVNDIQEFNKELKIYDIKKKRDNLILMFNEIINLYSQIIIILKKIYKEKDINIAISKYKLDSDKLKKEINEIIHKAESYLESDKNNKPKFKIRNIKYFFHLINEKDNIHKLLTDKMNIYSLNCNINANIEKSFNKMEQIMKTISHKENAFELKNNLKNEYEKIIKNYEDLIVVKNKKKNFFRRKSVEINLNKVHLQNFPFMSLDNDNSKSDSSIILSDESK